MWVFFASIPTGLASLEISRSIEVKMSCGTSMSLIATSDGYAPFHDSSSFGTSDAPGSVPRSGAGSAAVRGNVSTESSSALEGRGRFNSATVPNFAPVILAK